MDPEKQNEREEIVADALGFHPKKLLTTFKALNFKAGESVTNYCHGDRTTLMRPIPYFLLFMGLATFLLGITGAAEELRQFVQTMLGDAEAGTSHDIGDTIGDALRKEPSWSTAEIEKLSHAIRVGENFLGSMQGRILLLLPVYVPIQWFLLRKHKPRFLHHLYFYLFTAAQINAWDVPLLLIFPFVPGVSITLMFVMSLLAVIYLFYSAYRFFEGITVTQLVMKSVAGLALAVVPMMIWYFTLWSASTYVLYKLF